MKWHLMDKHNPIWIVSKCTISSSLKSFCCVCTSTMRHTHVSISVRFYRNILQLSPHFSCRPDGVRSNQGEACQKITQSQMLRSAPVWQPDPLLLRGAWSSWDTPRGIPLLLSGLRCVFYILLKIQLNGFRMCDFLCFQVFKGPVCKI